MGKILDLGLRGLQVCSHTPTILIDILIGNAYIVRSFYGHSSLFA